MTEQEFRQKVAENISFFRKRAGLTQSMLAEKLNYSDKSVSKWERADGMPDIFVLRQMAEIFGVTVSELIGEDTRVNISEKQKTRRRIIPVLSAGIVWLAAALLFFVLKVLPFAIPKTWLVFIFALPVSCIVLLVFACIWYGNVFRCLCTSGIIWGFFLFLRLAFSGTSINYLLIAAGILQVMAILWFYMLHRGRKKQSPAPAAPANDAGGENAENGT